MRIIRTAAQEMIVNNGAAKTLLFMIHWKGPAHTHFDMGRALFGREQRTATEDPESIPPMARRGDVGIELKIATLGCQQEKAKCFSPPLGDPPKKTPHRPCSLTALEIFTRVRFPNRYGPKKGTILRLVRNDFLNNRQMEPWRTWEIKRPRVASPDAGSALVTLRPTGKLATLGVHS
jgi:hypothetical protein